MKSREDGKNEDGSDQERKFPIRTRHLESISHIMFVSFNLSFQMFVHVCFFFPSVIFI